MAAQSRASVPYAPLYCKSHYSFLEGASHPEELLERAAELGIESLALTDRDGLYSAVRAHVKAWELGLHLVVGARMTVADGSAIVLLAADGTGYAHLCRLISAGRLRSPKGKSVVEWREVCAHASGLVALWGGEESLLVREPEPAFVARDLRDAFGVVPQDVTLFNDTLYHNIAYGRLDATEADVEQATILARLDDLIDRLPNGFDTVVGERGLKLSGGEKQRVAIARAILKDPTFLIFDEATSSLDTVTERAIMHAINEVSARHTTLIISHRLSTVVDADQIVLLENGTVLETGNHAELLTQRGKYAEMWAVQRKDRAALETVDATQRSMLGS